MWATLVFSGYVCMSLQKVWFVYAHWFLSARMSQTVGHHIPGPVKIEIFTKHICKLPVLALWPYSCRGEDWIRNVLCEPLLEQTFIYGKYMREGGSCFLTPSYVLFSSLLPLLYCFEYISSDLFQYHSWLLHDQDPDTISGVWVLFVLCCCFCFSLLLLAQ